MNVVSVAGLGIAGISAIVAIAAHAEPSSERCASNAPKAEAVDDAAGNLHVPDGLSHRLSIAGKLGGGSGARAGVRRSCTSCYASPGTIAAYRRDGTFPRQHGARQRGVSSCHRAR